MRRFRCLRVFGAYKGRRVVVGGRKEPTGPARDIYTRSLGLVYEPVVTITVPVIDNITWIDVTNTRWLQEGDLFRDFSTDTSHTDRSG